LIIYKKIEIRMRPSRVFRWIVRLFLLVLTLSMTVVSLLGGMSAALILGDPNNIRVPSGTIQYNFNITDVNSMYLRVPFNITNAGYFDLTNLKIDFKISMIYDHVNLTTPGVNTTTSVLIFDKSINFPTILHGMSYNGLFNASSGDGFIVSNFPNATTQIDWTRSPVAEFYSNFSLSASYSLDLISFKVNAFNISVGYLY
jgi:hypothetical protein